jgi:uncharacterized membrane protein
LCDDLIEQNRRIVRRKSDLYHPLKPMPANADPQRKWRVMVRYSTVRHCLAAAMLFALGISLCPAQSASYFTIRVPGALGTYPMSVNDSLVVTGYYLVSATESRGFLQAANGAITTFAIPGSIWTEPESINASGDVTGYYETAPGYQHGFIRYANGRVVTFDGPCAANVPNCGAQPVSINDFKEVVGSYPSPLQDKNNFLGAFSRSSAGVFTSYVLTQGGSYQTIGTGVNASGTVIGYFTGGAGKGDTTGFEAHPDGYLTEFRFPPEDAGGVAGSIGTTLLESINASGVIAGWYRVCSSTPCETWLTGAFVLSTQGVFTIFNPPGPIVTSAQPSPFLAINDDGIIAGSYTDQAQAQHGFVREANGMITSFDPPNGRQTTATSINNLGVITGSFYNDSNSQIAIGFLRIPTT